MLNVVVKSAVELSAGQLNEIKKAVTAKYGKDVDVQKVIDPSLLGGVQIIVGSRLIDGSVRGKLTQLQTAIRNGS